MKVLCKFEFNWADEIDFEELFIIEKKELEELLEKMKKDKKRKIIFSVGGNQYVKEEIGELLKGIKYTDIIQQEEEKWEGYVKRYISTYFSSVVEKFENK